MSLPSHRFIPLCLAVLATLLAATPATPAVAAAPGGGVGVGRAGVVTDDRVVETPLSTTRSSVTTPSLAPGPRSDKPLARDGVLPRRGYIRKWPGNTIRYWAKVPASYQWSLDAAIQQWNRTGLDMTFVRVPRSRAQLSVTVGDTQGADGLATVGYQPRNWVHLARNLMRSSPGMTGAYVRVVAAHIITHELGHNLGLQHTSGCHLMGPILYLPDCPMMADEIGQYRCRIVDAQALDRTVRLYGGRRTMAPQSCLLDAPAASLTGIAFDGGLAADAPVSIRWDPARASARVLVLLAAGEQCSFPVAANYWGEMLYDPGRVQVLRVDPSAGRWQQDADAVTTRCYGVQPVNRSGAGPTPVTRTLTSWVPAPAPPTVQVVRRARDPYALDYSAELTWDADRTTVRVLSAPTGQCVTSWPTGEPYDDHRVFVEGDGTVQFDALGTDPCLSFFTLSSDGTRVSSTAATWQVGVEPPPAKPVVTSVRRGVGSDSYGVDASWQILVADLAVVVRPKGACVASWPPGEDPEAHLVGSGTVVDAPGVVQPCLSFFTVNAVGGTSSPAVTWQVLPAPAAPAPDITGLTLGDGFVSGFTTLDADNFYLLAVARPPGECVDAIPEGEDPLGYLTELYSTGTAGRWEFDALTSDAHPCLTFFAINADEVVGPAVKRQL